MSHPIRALSCFYKNEHANKFLIKLNKYKIYLLSISLFVSACSKSDSSHSDKEPKSKGATNLPVTAVVKATRQDLEQSLTVSGEFRPYQQVALHARVGGYLQSISVDTGDHVVSGQTIAQLDTPELRSELEKAVAVRRAAEQDIIRTQGIYEDARLALHRLKEVAKQNPKLVAQQEIDLATTKDSNAASGVAAAKQRLEGCIADENKVLTLLGYTTIVAPFDGVITKRYADPGALIQSGNTSSNHSPLVDLLEDKRLRLTFPVPESAAPLIQEGTPIKVSVASLNKTLTGNVTRFSGKIDRATRTMVTEATIINTDNDLKPGMVAEVSLLLKESKNAVSVPTQALLTGATTRVLVVDENGVIQDRTIKLGLRTPARTEALEGVKEGEMVVVGSRAEVQAGTKVQPKIVELSNKE